VIHVVTVADLARPSVPAAVMRDDAIPFVQQVEHLRIPVVAAQRPSVMEHDRLSIL
jgi:hypothetical protein